MLAEAKIINIAIRAAAIFLFIVASVLGGAIQLYMMAVMLAVIPVISWALGKMSTSNVECRRKSAATCAAHEQIEVSLILKNCSAFPKFNIRIDDRFPRLVRYAGNGTRQGLIAQLINPHETATFTYKISPQRRGIHQLGPIRLIATDPLGLCMRKRTIPSYMELTVYPQVLRVHPDLLSSAAGRGWQDRLDAKSRGAGSDFDGVRAYRTGDELRRINWKATARTGNLAVTEFIQGDGIVIYIVIDTSEESYKGTGDDSFSAMEYAVTIAASIASNALQRHNIVQIVSSDRLLEPLTELRDIHSLSIALEYLARIEPVQTPSFAEVAMTCMNSARQDASFIFITPEKRDDPALRAAMKRWNSSQNHGGVLTFWLDAPSFREHYASDPANNIRFTHDRVGIERQAITNRSDCGVEITITPRINLSEALQEFRHV
jgi:uncharacterized protein (DUF58 family)